MVMYDTYARLLPGEGWSSASVGPQNRDELSQIIRYVGFFAKIKLLIDIDAIDIQTIDRMFVFRFFLAVHNRHVQEQILYSPLYEGYWSQIFELHHRWSEFRRSRNLKIPFSESSLELFDKSRYSLFVEETKMELRKREMS